MPKIPNLRQPARAQSTPAQTLRAGLALTLLLMPSCAPPTSMLAGIPMAPGLHNEIGLSANLVGDDGDISRCAPNAQLWYLHQLDNDFSVGGTLFGGFSALAGAGLVLRVPILRNDRMTMHFDYQMGLLYLSFSLPLAYRLSPKLWFYTAPSLGYRLQGLFRVPVGLELELGRHGLLALEVGAGMGESSPYYTSLTLYPYAALMTGVRF